MRRGRIILWGLAGAAAGGLLIASGGLRFAATAIVIAGQSLFPSTISWDSHGAYVKCESAIADATRWPTAPAEACRAMTMCANEAVLSERQSAALSEAVGKTPGCGPL